MPEGQILQTTSVLFSEMFVKKASEGPQFDFHFEFHRAGKSTILSAYEPQQHNLLSDSARG